MIDELIDNYGWVSTVDGYSLSESHPFYVEGIFGGVRVIWENNNLEFYEVGRLYEALEFHGLLMGVDWAVYEVKTVEMGGSLSTPPHSPTHPNDTPLVETATATADNGDEITADKLVSIGFSPDTPWLYSRETRSDTFIVFDEDDNSICITNGDGTINITAHVTTMTELRTLIRWLS